MSVRSVAAVFLGSLRISIRGSEVQGRLLSPAVASIVPAVVIAWLAARSQDPRALPFVLIGAALMSVWTYAVLRLGFILFVDFATGRLELLMSSRAPLWVVNLGAAFAVVIWSLPGAAIAAVMVVVVAGTMPTLIHPVLIVCAVGGAIVGITSVGFLLAPLRLITGGREGFFNALIPFGILVGGFLYPVSILPRWLEVLGRALPLSWAATAGDVAFAPSRASGGAWRDLGISLALSVAYVGISVVLYRLVEHRLRYKGEVW